MAAALCSCCRRRDSRARALEAAKRVVLISHAGSTAPLRTDEAFFARLRTPAPATAPTGALLTVTIKDLRNKKGAVIFGVFPQANAIPNVKSKSTYGEVKPADADTVIFTPRVPPGRYAAGVLHDENRNGEMD